jgi:predicted Fe-Mo cluster-binding NifX family protein
MKIAVTYDPSEGLIFQHFGHTEFFKLYTVENGEIVSDQVISAAGAGHEALADYLKGLGADTLICGGIGGGAVNALTAAGIQIYGGITGLPDAAVEALLRGILARNSDANCTHHHDHGEGGCGDHHGSGGCHCHG